MGAAKRKTEQFLKDHPTCCFCGGAELATTRDHIPSRACFPKKVGPDGFVFPACHRCQSLLRKEEQFFAFFARITDHDDNNRDLETNKRLISGIENNMPELMPDVRLSANQKRKAVSSMGLQKPNGVAFSQLPIARYSDKANSSIRSVATKIGLALYYKHKGYAAPTTHKCVSYWTHVLNAKQIEGWRQVAENIGSVVWGTRPNKDMRNLFRYGWAAQEPNVPDIFIVICEFGKGLAICSMIWDPKIDRSNAISDESMTIDQWLAEQ